jgi:hypothetical protein
MPIQRDLYSPNNDYEIFSKNLITNNEQQKNKTNNINMTSSELENINEIRKLIREQTILATNTFNNNSNNLKIRISNLITTDSSEELADVPLRRFTPLPDIPRLDEPYFR